MVKPYSSDTLQRKAEELQKRLAKRLEQMSRRTRIVGGTVVDITNIATGQVDVNIAGSRQRARIVTPVQPAVGDRVTVAIKGGALDIPEVIGWVHNAYVSGTPWQSAYHNFLSATHLDTTPATRQRGDLVVGGAAAWNRLALGTSGTALWSNGTDTTWHQPAHADLSGITANQHHAQSHALADATGLGADHTTSGLTAGQVLRATGATTAAFALLQAGDLPTHSHQAVGQGGQLDHGLALTGLADDDHSVYALTTHSFITLAAEARFANERVLTGSPSVLVADGGAGTTATLSVIASGVDHGGLGGLGDDDHTQYALLLGRAGGQTLIGGTAASNTLTLQSTSHATRGKLLFGSAGASVFDEVNNRWGFGTATPGNRVSVDGVEDHKHTITNTTDTAHLVNDLYINPSGAHTGVIILNDNRLRLQGANNFNVVYAMSGQVIQEGTGAVATAAGMAFYALRFSGVSGPVGTITWVRGIQVLPLNIISGAPSGTVTNLASFYARQHTGLGTGPITVTNFYGLYLEALSGGTNTWDIYHAGTAPNIGIGNGGTLTWKDSAGNVLASLKDNGSTGRFYVSGDLGIGVTAPLTLLNLQETKTITGLTADGKSAAITLDPRYTAASAQTVTRHNYMDLLNATLTDVTVTDAAVMRFDAAAGTHKAVDTGTTKTTPGAVDAWLKVNISGTIYYVPAYLSKTT